jgi:hypothetical protein
MVALIENELHRGLRLTEHVRRQAERRMCVGVGFHFRIPV